MPAVMLRSVVVTGMGVLSPLGVGVELNWQRLLAGQSGIRPITEFQVDDLPCRIAGTIPKGATSDGLFQIDDWVDTKEQRKMDPFIAYAMAAASMALADSGWQAKHEEERERAGVLIGSGIGGLQGITEGGITVHEKGPRRLSPFYIPSNLINLASGFVSIRHNLKGPNHAVVTACASGTHAIGDAARLIALGDADMMLAGGAESAVCRIGIAGFCAARALSTGYNDQPERASRPWDKDRDGFVMGEGAAILVLEAEEVARSRGAKIIGRVIGYGLSGDAYHLTAPTEDGNGAYRAMKAAVRNAGIEPASLDYINAHGTSTPLGDQIEHMAVKRLLGDAAASVAMSSTKSAIGHLLGAAGAVEAVYSLLAIRDGKIPPTLNLDNPSEGCDMNLVPHKSQEKPIQLAMSNSFGFGGTNASLIFAAP